MILSILADENIPGVDDCLDTVANICRVSGRTINPSQLDNVDVLLVRSVTRVNAALLRNSSVKFVGTATSGFDHIDRDYLAHSSIGFAHAPGSNANSVVEYVLAAIAVTGDKLEQLLAGGTVGIVGYGTIGRAVAARLEALGIQYRISDPWLDQHIIPNVAQLSEVLDCDVVTLHAELTKAQPWPSHHLLSSEELEKLRPGSLLINACRGPVVDNAALFDLLKSKDEISVVLDVWEGEPVINAALLEQVRLGTPHIAGYSWDGKLRATRQLSDALADFFGISLPRDDGSVIDVEPIAVPGNLNRPGLIRFLVLSRYDILLDDALLRDATAAEPHDAENGVRFDALRKLYRRRRELAGSTVLGLESPDQIASARGLGCIPIVGSGR